MRWKIGSPIIMTLALLIVHKFNNIIQETFLLDEQKNICFHLLSVCIGTYIKVRDLWSKS